MNHPTTYVSPAVEAVRAMKAQDDDAAAAWPKCRALAQHAIQIIKQQGSLDEAEVLCLLHAMQSIVERGGNMLMPHWIAIVDDLESAQAACSDAIDDEAADAISRELITAQAWGGI